jgi:dihydroxyacetone kinase
MNRIVNDPNFVVEDMLKGFVKANNDIVAATDNPRVLKYAHAPVQGKVGVITGGGSGHKPAFIGYIGKNMCDAVAVGEIFSSPSAAAFLDAIKAADSGRGVACLYGNYAGDNMNVRMAMRKAKEAGIDVRAVVANDRRRNNGGAEGDRQYPLRRHRNGALHDTRCRAPKLYYRRRQDGSGHRPSRGAGRERAAA